MAESCIGHSRDDKRITLQLLQSMYTFAGGRFHHFATNYQEAWVHVKERYWELKNQFYFEIVLRDATLVRFPLVKEFSAGV